MQYSINPVKVKINDTENCNQLDVVITQDNGTQCAVAYRLSVAGQQQLSHQQANGSNGNYKVTGADYTSYNAATDRFHWTAQYVATKLSLTLAA